MEIEFFCRPDESEKWYRYWRDVRINWYTRLGIKSDKLRPREQSPEERAHYSVGTTDIEYLFPFAAEAKRKPPYRFIPHVIEPSAGADRFALAVLCEAYAEDTVGGEARTVMRFHPRLAPVKAAVFPLVNREGIPEKAHALYRELKKDFNVVYDDGGAVGRRYRRQDEAGTPFCITVDGQTLQDDTVTLRDRDTTEQRRLPMRAVADELRKLLEP